MIIKNGKTTSALYKGTKEIVKRYKGTLVVYEAWKKLIASGVPPITLQKCKGVDLVDYKIYGDSKQNGTPTPDTPIEIESVGRKSTNILPFPYDYMSRTANGITFTANDDGMGRIVAEGVHNGNGLSTHLMYFGNTIKAINNKLEREKTYYLAINSSKEPPTGLRYYAMANITKANGSSYYPTSSFVLNEGDELKSIDLRIYATDGVEREINVEFYPMLSETTYEFEPYRKYKIPVKTKGKNLFDINNTDNWVSASGTATYNNYPIFVGANKTVSISWDNDLSLGQGFYLVFGYKSSHKGLAQGTWLYHSTQQNLCKQSIKVTADEDGYIYINMAPKKLDKLTNLQIEYGDTITEYEPYVEPITTNIYLNEPLRKIGDVADYIDFEKGKVVRKVKTQNLDSTYKSITKYTWVNKVGLYFGVYLDNSYERIPGLSNRNADFTANPQATTSMWLGIKNQNFFWIGILDYLGFEDDDISTAVDKFRIWLADNPTYIYYPTSTPTEETIELPNIPTHKGTTVIEVDTSILPSNMEVTYLGKK